MSTDTVITIGTAFDRRMEVEVIKRQENHEGVNMAFIRLPSGLEAWVKPTSLKREPKVEATTMAAFVKNENADPVTEPGMYMFGADIFKVQRSKTSGNLYAKRLQPIGGARLNHEDIEVGWEFIYDQGAVYRLKSADRMTVEEASLFGIKFGVCCVCGITLKDAKSVAAGVGPVCAKRV